MVFQIAKKSNRFNYSELNNISLRNYFVYYVNLNIHIFCKTKRMTVKNWKAHLNYTISISHRFMI